MEGNLKSIVACTVSPEDTDGYGHLNNARYSEYFEKGRVDLLESFGLGVDELKKEGVGFWVRSAHIRYISQVSGNSKVVIHSRFMDYSKGAVIRMEQEMVCRGELMASSVTEHFFVKLNGKNPKPIKPLERIIEMLQNKLHPAVNGYSGNSS